MWMILWGDRSYEDHNGVSWSNRGEIQANKLESIININERCKEKWEGKERRKKWGIVEITHNYKAHNSIQWMILQWYDSIISNKKKIKREEEEWTKKIWNM